MSSSVLQFPKSSRKVIPVDMDRVSCIILGGGQGTRLFPLTETRCKPAICFGGRYRLIDVPISNAVNSGCYKISIITQFLSSSIHRHIFQSYHMDQFSSGFIDILSAEQKPTEEKWFQGTADAVRQNTHILIDIAADYFLILSGDQLYNMDFRKMVAYAQTTDADLIIATLPIDREQSSSMGVLKVKDNHEIVDFIEKPSEDQKFDDFELSPHFLEQEGFNPHSDRRHLGSMGIYLFKRDVMFDLLNRHDGIDFGKHLIPEKVKQGGVYAFVYDGYWEDIGTIRTFFDANMALTEPFPKFNCYDKNNPIFTSDYQLPGPKIFDTKITHSIICEGAIIEAKEIANSILGPRTIVKKGTVIENSYLMGNDDYSPPVEDSPHYPKELGIGEDCVIRNAIIDKNVYLGKGVRLINERGLKNYDGDHLFVRDGIIVVTRGASFSDGFTF
ncbi:MAG: Glucose-1-phosphate adenylyltransferase [Chlamydiae bacterium]|nr:Glucose-1-phosphate adenylyltransferase [Chlamydiota bacterium]